MTDVSDLPILFERLEVLIKSYLTDLGNYPQIEGRVAFFDEDVYRVYEKVKRFRPDSHMVDADLWDVEISLEGDMIYFDIKNRKTVSGTKDWNLVDDILAVGTTSYTGKQRMSFFDRYKQQWKFNRYTRRGIGQGFVTAFDTLLDNAILDSARQVGEEWRDGRL
jgi:hypothetical protein